MPAVRAARITASSKPADDHGRSLSTSVRAAGLYRRAVRVLWERPDDSTRLLGAALGADAGFALAAAGLAALAPSGISPLLESPPGNRLECWERRHLDVVGVALEGDGERASALLREHLTDVGCDPVAFFAVARLRRRRDDLAGLADAACPLHLPQGRAAHGPVPVPDRRCT